MLTFADCSTCSLYKLASRYSTQLTQHIDLTSTLLLSRVNQVGTVDYQLVR